MQDTPAHETHVESVTVGPYQENTYFLRSRSREDIVVIDPGDEADRLIATIESNGWSPVAILNTHAHLDHICAVERLKRRYDVPFYLHADDQPTLELAPHAARMFGFAIPELPEVDRPLEPDTTLELAGLTINVLFTPGHTPGGVSSAVDNRVFSGDCLFAGSIGRTDLPGGNLPALMTSIRDRLLTLPDETVVHAGHGPDTTIGRERAANPFLQAAS